MAFTLSGRGIEKDKSMNGKPPEYKKTLAQNIPRNTPQNPTDFPICDFSVSEYRLWAEEWILDGELRQLSLRTLAERRDLLEKLFWFLDREGRDTLGLKELKAFFHHLNNGHTDPGGRFGNPRLTAPLRPVSLRGWHIVLSAWFGWMVKEEYLEANLIKRVPAPIVREDIKQPLSGEQLRRLLAAAKRSPHARRDVALLLFLADTGVRCTELIELKTSNVDLQSRTFKVTGKGRKNRQGYLGSATTQALKAYGRSKRGKKCEYVFESEKGNCGNIGEPLTRSGVQQMLKRLAQAAGIQGQVSPHQFRRFASVEFLRGGGSVFALQQMLGHSTLAMTRRYCSLAEADVEAQHRQFSPADRLLTR
jgi:site-specific recombinase XerD